MTEHMIIDLQTRYEDIKSSKATQKEELAIHLDDSQPTDLSNLNAKFKAMAPVTLHKSDMQYRGDQSRKKPPAQKRPRNNGPRNRQTRQPNQQNIVSILRQILKEH